MGRNDQGRTCHGPKRLTKAQQARTETVKRYLIA